MLFLLIKYIILINKVYKKGYIYIYIVMSIIIIIIILSIINEDAVVTVTMTTMRMVHDSRTTAKRVSLSLSLFLK